MRDVRKGWGDVWLAGLTAVGGLRPFHRVARKAIVSLRASDMIPRHATGSINGRKVRLDLNEMVDQKIALFGAFDARGLGLIKRVMQAINCRTVVDVGANIGNHTAFFSDWASRVIAIEPNPPVFQRLAQFIDENHLSNVTPLQ